MNKPTPKWALHWGIKELARLNPSEREIQLLFSDYDWWIKTWSSAIPEDHPSWIASFSYFHSLYATLYHRTGKRPQSSQVTPEALRPQIPAARKKHVERILSLFRERGTPGVDDVNKYSLFKLQQETERRAIAESRARMPPQPSEYATPAAEPAGNYTNILLFITAAAALVYFAPRILNKGRT